MIIGVRPVIPTGRVPPKAFMPVVSRLEPGPRYIMIYLLALPVVVVALASAGWEQMVSGLIALTWLVLAPAALFARWAATVLPIASALFMCLGILVLSFNSAAFVVDLAATAAMFLVTFPRQGPRLVPHSSGLTRV